MTVEDKLKVYRQIASLAAAGTPQDQIADVFGVTRSRISQICQEEGYKEVLAQVKDDNIQKKLRFDNSWDHLEITAADVVMENLRFNKDADFALRVAAIANKAVRRGGALNPAIDGGHQPRTTISLPHIFVTVVQNNQGQVDVKKPLVIDPNGVPQQRIKSMLPTEVNNILSAPLEQIEAYNQDRKAAE